MITMAIESLPEAKEEAPEAPDGLVETVVEIADDITSVEEPWTDRGEIVEYAYVDGHGEDEIRDAIQVAVDDDRLFSWHGLIVHGDDARLKAMQQQEAAKDYTRHILMRKANKHRLRLRGEGGDEA